MTASSSPFPRLFEPIRVGPVEVRNRLFLSPHQVAHHFSVLDPDLPGFYLPTPGLLDYYAARARGGVGLIIQGATVVQPSSWALMHLEAFADHTVPHFRRIADGVHEAGAALF